MYVGSIVHPNQGVPLLIEALPAGLRGAARAPAASSSAARPRPATSYRSRLGEYGDRLIVLTGRTPEQVVALTRRADVLVHSRLACRENYSVQSKLAVYLASGRPIVATDFGDYAPLLGPTGAGRLTTVDPGLDRRGHPRRPRATPTLAARLAASTRAVAEEYFGMDRNLDRYLAAYGRALSLGTRPAPRRSRALAG